MIKAVVFDLDDTLILEEHYIESGFKHISKILSKRYSRPYEEIFNDMVKLFKDSNKNVFNRLLEKLNISYSEKDIEELIYEYRIHKPEIKLIDEAVEVINILKSKGLLLGMITDGYKETQLNKIEVLECRKLFDEIIVTDELGREFWKPHEKAYVLMSDKLEVDFEEMIYVGDNINKDFIKAKKLGLKTLQIVREKGVYKDINIGEEYEADYKIRSLLDIVNFL